MIGMFCLAFSSTREPDIVGCLTHFPGQGPPMQQFISRESAQFISRESFQFIFRELALLTDGGRSREKANLT